jgi:hypothetical protein
MGLVLVVAFMVNLTPMFSVKRDVADGNGNFETMKMNVFLGSQSIFYKNPSSDNECVTCEPSIIYLKPTIQDKIEQLDINVDNACQREESGVDCSSLHCDATTTLSSRYRDAHSIVTQPP